MPLRSKSSFGTELEEIAIRFNTLRSDITEREKEMARLDSRIEYLQESAKKMRESARQNSTSLTVSPSSMAGFRRMERCFRPFGGGGARGTRDAGKVYRF